MKLNKIELGIVPGEWGLSRLKVPFTATTILDTDFFPLRPQSLKYNWIKLQATLLIAYSEYIAISLLF
jgi:hypothetical protein